MMDMILQPEMEMVARGLEKLLKVEQREFLMNMLVGVCSEESHRSAAEALGLVLSPEGNGDQHETTKNVQKPSYNQLFGYSSAPNMKYASMFGCRASAATASDDGENSSLSSSVLMPKQKTKESILINENGSTNTGIGIVEFL
ncbi:hypothetical protein JRO89_XS03G0008500 [Xanthoceras sorbifolium]|uniref:Uncharacterized protein n=1 Tax=Xanthoceras sorbifolium TaxID=99658 RepID=A0ABQ8I804_9ROSI|nr:hypothetical protein JRO89_XS03G0008500 [Xanthoceras sorbifolium]